MGSEPASIALFSSPDSVVPASRKGICQIAAATTINTTTTITAPTTMAFIFGLVVWCLRDQALDKLLVHVNEKSMCLSLLSGDTFEVRLVLW